MTKAKRIAVKDLRAGSVEATPINVEDWREVFAGHDGYTQTENTFWEAQTCQDCDTVMVFENGGGNEQHCDLEDSKCEGYFGSAEGPMMNYWYKVDLSKCNDDPDEAARLIADLPLCVVQINGEYGLALTGGGMDLSWEICEAFTRIGQLPPSHFCDLPGMAGRGTNTQDKYIMAACRETIRVQMNWLKGKLRSLRSLSTRSKAHA